MQLLGCRLSELGQAPRALLKTMKLREKTSTPNKETFQRYKLPQGRLDVLGRLPCPVTMPLATAGLEVIPKVSSNALCLICFILHKFSRKVFFLPTFHYHSLS